ncbi:MAG TPA: PilZ domain-containing protein [Thermoanaerobaculia bacterium]|nr:PilZ domain-containing protein [Thermoanaerobaculia bacterium]
MTQIYPSSSILSQREKRVALAGPPDGALRGAAQVLKRAGYLVAHAEDPEALLGLEAGITPDLVIFDIAMPPDGAVAVAQRLRARAYWRFVSMMLAVPAGRPRLEEVLAAGINDLILSPFPPEELLDKARRLTVIPARRELNTLARVRDPKAEGPVQGGKTLNVSSNGILVETESPLVIGRTVDIEFFLPEDPEAVRATGRVVRRTTELDLLHPAFGIRFVEMPEKDEARIEAFVIVREKGGARRPAAGG